MYLAVLEEGKDPLPVEPVEPVEGALSPKGALVKLRLVKKLGRGAFGVVWLCYVSPCNAAPAGLVVLKVGLTPELAIGVIQHAPLCLHAFYPEYKGLRRADSCGNVLSACGLGLLTARVVFNDGNVELDASHKGGSNQQRAAAVANAAMRREAVRPEVAQGELCNRGAVVV